MIEIKAWWPITELGRRAGELVGEIRDRAERDDWALIRTTEIPCGQAVVKFRSGSGAKVSLGTRNEGIRQALEAVIAKGGAL